MNQKTLSGVLLDEQVELSLSELSYACCSSAEWIIELVDEGGLEVISHKRHKSQNTPWRFSADSLLKAQTARRLQRDLNINLAGVVLVLDLLQQIEQLESELSILKNTNI